MPCSNMSEELKINSSFNTDKITPENDTTRKDLNIDAEIEFGRNLRTNRDQERQVILACHDESLLLANVIKPQTRRRHLQKPRIKKQLSPLCKRPCKKSESVQSTFNRKTATKKQYFDYLSKPTLKPCPSECKIKQSKPFQPKPCSPRCAQLANPTKKRVLDTWLTYKNVLEPEQILWLKELLKKDEALLPIDAKRYFHKLDQKKKQLKKQKDKKQKKNAIKKPRKSKVMKEIALLAELIVKYFSEMQLQTVKYNHMILTELMKNKLENAGLIPIGYKRCNEKDICGQTLYETLDQIAVWLESNITMEDLDSDEEGTEVSETISTITYSDVLSYRESVEEVEEEEEEEFIIEFPEEIYGGTIEEEVEEAGGKEWDEGEVSMKQEGEKEGDEGEVSMKQEGVGEGTEGVEGEEEEGLGKGMEEEWARLASEAEEEAARRRKEQEEAEAEAEARARAEAEAEAARLEAEAEAARLAAESYGIGSSIMEDILSFAFEFEGREEAEAPGLTIEEHSPDAVCCVTLKTWATWLVDVAHNTHGWCQWIQDIIAKIRFFAALLKGEIRGSDGKPRKLHKEEWDSFTNTLQQDIDAWYQYNTHVKELSDKIIAGFKGKRVICCAACLKSKLIISAETAHQVTDQLVEALNTTAYWRSWLNAIVAEAEKLAQMDLELPSTEDEDEGEISGVTRSLESSDVFELVEIRAPYVRDDTSEFSFVEHKEESYSKEPSVIIAELESEILPTIEEEPTPKPKTPTKKKAGKAGGKKKK